MSELEDCAVGVDAAYYLASLLDQAPAHEPLLSALGGLTSIEARINENLDFWKANKIIPFFVFDGQSVAGQDEVALKRGRNANHKTDEAWKLYSQNSGDEAVAAFGANPGSLQSARALKPRLTRTIGAFRLQNIFPLLQAILKKRSLHFLVAPYNASAQVSNQFA